jgi:hypothetical protein
MNLFTKTNYDIDEVFATSFLKESYMYNASTTDDQ